jgi:hypothetical protein
VKRLIPVVAALLLLIAPISFGQSYKASIELAYLPSQLGWAIHELFGLFVTETGSMRLIVTGEPLSRFKKLAENRSYIKSIDGKILKGPIPNSVPESVAIFIVFADDATAGEKKAIEVFFELTLVNSYEISRISSYSARIVAGVDNLIAELSSFPFVTHVETEKTYKAF